MTLDLTNTPDDAGLAEQARAYMVDERDHDDGTRVDHEPCDRAGCLVCDVLPRVVATRACPWCHTGATGELCVAHWDEAHDYWDAS